MKKKLVDLLVIDPQVDFCDLQEISSTRAEEDMQRLASFLKKFNFRTNEIKLGIMKGNKS